MSCNAGSYAPGKFCSSCGRRTAVASSPKELAELQRVALRVTSLSVTARGMATDADHKAEWARFAVYMQTRNDRDPVDATPLHIIGYLMDRDAAGQKILHAVTCETRTATKQSRGACTCPVRLAFKTVDSKIGYLSACFNALAITGEYDPRTSAGNPCLSRVVRLYNANIEKEQLALGMVPKQAALFSVAVYDSIIQHCVSQARRSAAEPNAALQWIQTALMFALLFNTYNRGANICDITWAQLDVFTDASGARALRLLCSMSKTAGARRTSTRRGLWHALRLRV